MCNLLLFNIVKNLVWYRVETAAVITIRLVRRLMVY